MIKKILIMAGGTGGHIFPGIAIAKALQKQGIEVIWLGSVGGMESELVPKAGIALLTLSITGFRGKSFLGKLGMPFLLSRAVYQAYKLLKKEKPDKVIGMGGFVAAPGGIAAKLRRIPLFIHEQNRIAGWTNKLLSRIANRVFCAFPDTFPASAKVIVTGNPVREDIQSISSKNSCHSPPRILVLGGSRGAKVLNTLVPQAISLLSNHFQLEIYHQTGKASSAHYTIPATITPFIQDIAKVYDWADIIICRSGALTLAELTTVGLPAILVPFPYAVDDHQTANARYLEEKGAALLLPQSECTPEKLSALLLSLMNEPARYAAVAKASRALAQRAAVEKIVCFLNDEEKSIP